ncbi:MAG: OsmC family protein [Flavipsychrobacter sp.]
MAFKVVYTGNLRTECTHLRSGSVIETDAPTDNRGKGERFSPTDLVATALAACIVTTMGIAGDTHGIDIDGTVCDVEKIMVSDPRRIGEIKVQITMPADKTYSEKERLILERAAVTCPVAKSLHPNLKETISFVWG